MNGACDNGRCRAFSHTYSEEPVWAARLRLFRPMPTLREVLELGQRPASHLAFGKACQDGEGLFLDLESYECFASHVVQVLEVVVEGVELTIHYAPNDSPQ